MTIYDLRHALKALVRRPGLSLAVLTILALGIGSTTTIFSIVSSVLLSEIPYPEGDRLVVLRMLVEEDGSTFPASYPDVQSWREQSRTHELISASSNGQQLNLTGDGRAERVGVSFVAASYFDLLGARPFLGRSFEPGEDDRTNPSAVTVLSHGLWKRRFGGDRTIVGRSIELQGITFQVIGVLPEGFRDIYTNIDLYVPVTISRLTHREGYVEDRASRWLDVFARRRPGVSIEQAQQEMLSITRQLIATFPTTNQGYSVRVEPLRTMSMCRKPRSRRLAASQSSTSSKAGGLNSWTAQSGQIVSRQRRLAVTVAMAPSYPLVDRTAIPKRSSRFTPLGQAVLRPPLPRSSNRLRAAKPALPSGIVKLGESPGTAGAL